MHAALVTIEYINLSESTPTHNKHQDIIIMHQDQQQRRRQLNKKERRIERNENKKNLAKLRTKQIRLINQNAKYFQNKTLALQLPLGFQVGEGRVVTVESDEALFLEMLKKTYKSKNDYDSVAYFSRIGMFLWYLVLILKCYITGSTALFIFLNVGLFVFRYVIFTRIQIFGGMLIDSFYHLHVARIFASYLDYGTWNTLNSYTEQFFLLSVISFFSIAFSILICQLAMRTIFASIPYMMSETPPRMKLYYDLLLCLSFMHFIYSSYISYEILYNLNVEYVGFVWW
jgi:hypothetical protein